MSDETPTPTAPAVPATPAAPAAEPAAPAPVAESAPSLSVEDLQKELAKVRQEAAGHRVAAKTAADDAQKALTDRLAVALGLKPDAAADPAALTASLTEAQTQAKQAARELAIFKASAATGADPSRLLDSNSFMSSVAGLDPSDGAAVTAAIQAAIAANPILKAVQAAAASGTELGGSGETGQITEQQLAAMSPEEKVAALRAGKLQHLL
jgi:hypothetical protein